MEGGLTTRDVNHVHDIMYQTKMMSTHNHTLIDIEEIVRKAYSNEDQNSYQSAKLGDSKQRKFKKYKSVKYLIDTLPVNAI